MVRKKFLGIIAIIAIIGRHGRRCHQTLAEVLPKAILPCLIIAGTLLLSACDTPSPDPVFVPVTDITGVDESVMIAGESRDMAIGVRVLPSNATNSTIVWSVQTAGETNADFGTGDNASVLTAPDAGTLIVRAAIVNGLTRSTDFVEVFTITVNPEPSRDPQNIVIPDNITATFGQTLAAIAGQKPATWTWVNPTALVGYVGERSHAAIYQRVGNYNAVQRDITVTVGQATPTVTPPPGLTAIVGQTLADVTLPDDWEWYAELTTLVGAAGPRQHDAVYTPANANFYSVTMAVTITVTAPPTEPDNIVIPTGISATFGQTLSQALPTLPATWTWVTPTDPVGNVGERSHAATYQRVGNYLSVQRNITVTVTQATPNVTAPTGISAIFGQTLSQALPALPERWAWVNEDALVGGAGTQQHDATYTPADEANYRSVTLPVTVTVAQATPAYTVPGAQSATFGDTLADIALTGRWAWVADDTTAVGDAGTQQHYARYTPESANFYSVDRPVTVTVSRAVPTYTVPGPLAATFGDTLADVTPALPANWAWQAAGTTLVGNAGEQTHYAIFSVAETANFTALTSVPYPITVNVARAVPSYEIPTGITAIIGQTLADVILPDNWTWVNASASVGAVGNNQHDAVFSVQQTDNFTALTVIHPVTVEVSDQERGTFTMTWNNFREGAPALAGPTLRILGGQADSVTVGTPELFTSIRWLRGNNEITGAAVSGAKGETLTLDAEFFGGIGQHTVTVEVVREDNGRLYSGRVTFTVRP